MPEWTKTKRAATAIAEGPRRWAPSFFFVYDVIILAGLLLLGPFRPPSWDVGGWLSNPIPDVLPSAVPWAGALGGVCISLVGVAGHARRGDWRPNIYGYWHLTRAALGAIFGSIAVLIISLLLQNVKQVPANAGVSHSGQAVLAVIAFVVGFREETFRSLIIRVVDIILGPSPNDPTTTYLLIPTALDLGTTTVGTAVTGTLHLFNGSNASLALRNEDLVKRGDGVDAKLDTDVVNVAKGETAAITVTWTPTKAGSLSDAEIQVNVPGRVVSTTLQGVAK